MPKKFKVLVLSIIIIIVIFTVTYLLVQYLLNPYRALNRFLIAIEEKDIDTIYAMILDEEKQYGITKEKIQELMNWMLYRHATKVKALVFPPNLADRWFRVPVKWLNGETNQPLTIKGRRLLGYINLFRPPKRWGWQISFTHFIKDYLYLNIAPIKLREQMGLDKRTISNYSYYKHFREKIVKDMLKQFGIRELFPLPTKVLRKGKYITIWKD